MNKIKVKRCDNCGKIIDNNPIKNEIKLIMVLLTIAGLSFIAVVIGFPAFIYHECFLP